ncbi:MAG: recombination regulator RecX [Lachnospiraceae bacterium]|nr:recombination regulator RecX [Lachnospiraceae bacterium]
MAHTITEVRQYDNKRNKVTLDNGEVTFLLYKGECRRFHLTPGTAAGAGQTGAMAGRGEAGPGASAPELSDADLRSILDEILLPRAKKRVLYYLKNADKTRDQIRRKLKEGWYPESVIEQTFQFLDKYGFADDTRYAEELIGELKGRKSAREIEQKLFQKGIRGDAVREQLGELTQEDEYTACEKALKKKYPAGIKKEDRNRAYAFLARRGFAYDAIEHAFRALGADMASNYDTDCEAPEPQYRTDPDTDGSI